VNIRQIVGSRHPELASYQPPDTAGIKAALQAVLDRGYADCGPQGRKPLTGGVSMVEAVRLANIIMDRGCTTCAETGVAFGVSTAAICLALAKLGSTGAIHYGIDPCQMEEHGGAALNLLKELGVQERFELLERPAHTGLAALLERGVQLDFAFIDGWHSLDYKLLDFFLMDKLLRRGGVVAMHDSVFRSTRSVLAYCLAYRKYKVLPYPKVSMIRTAQRLGHWFLLRSNHPRFTLRRLPNLVILEKLSDWEPHFDFYHAL
jgi:predicted O-methyltransferase YrrM